jgi:ferredoxin-NADP reductase
VDGAYGHFLLDEGSPAVLVAGGIGVTPLKGMAEYAADQRLPIDVRMLYSSRDEGEIAYRGELEALVEQNPRFEVLHTLTRPPADSSWTGRRGRINAEVLAEVSRGLPNPKFYVCGAPGLVQDSYRTLIGLGVPPDRIDFEVFRGYG